MQSRQNVRDFRVSPQLMMMTVRQLVKENAALFEEVKQLRAAVNVYRELAMRSSPAVREEYGFEEGRRQRKSA